MVVSATLKHIEAHNQKGGELPHECQRESVDVDERMECVCVEWHMRGCRCWCDLWPELSFCARQAHDSTVMFKRTRSLHVNVCGYTSFAVCCTVLPSIAYTKTFLYCRPSSFISTIDQ